MEGGVNMCDDARTHDERREPIKHKRDEQNMRASCFLLSYPSVITRNCKIEITHLFTRCKGTYPWRGVVVQVALAHELRG